MIPLRILLSKSLNTFGILKFKRINTSYSKYSTAKLQNIIEITPTKSEDVTETDTPIAYSKSPASQWQAQSSRMGTDMDRLWYEPIVVLGSIAVFMIYFCVLREESDIDKEFEKTLYNRFSDMEEKQIIICLEYNRQHGLETKALEDRLQEINEKKQ